MNPRRTINYGSPKSRIIYTSHLARAQIDTEVSSVGGKRIGIQPGKKKKKKKKEEKGEKHRGTRLRYVRQSAAIERERNHATNALILRMSHTPSTNIVLNATKPAWYMYTSANLSRDNVAKSLLVPL